MCNFLNLTLMCINEVFIIKYKIFIMLFAILEIPNNLKKERSNFICFMQIITYKKNENFFSLKNI